MSKRDPRKGAERIPVPRPGTRFTDKKKQASRTAARGWAKKRFTKEDE